MSHHLQIESLSHFTRNQPWRLSLLHDEPYDLLIWLTRGQGILQMNGTRQGVGAHSVILIPRGKVFALDLGRQAMAQIVRFSHPAPAWAQQAPRQLRIGNTDSITELTGLLAMAQCEISRNLPHMEKALSAFQTLINVWICRALEKAQHPPENSTPRKSGEDRATLRLTARFYENIPRPAFIGASMEDHAAALEVTPAHLTRLCKAATGQSAADHITAYLLYKAKTALIDGDRNAKEIAAELKFGDAASFTRFIQQHTGKTPGQFRRIRDEAGPLICTPQLQPDL